jgi:ATP-dependent Clp protease ATP-binding subunit ClpA
VTYFGETVIIATSNLGAQAVTELSARSGGEPSYEQVRAISVAGVRDYFLSINRPEIFGRIAGGIVPFDILRSDVIDQITTKFVTATAYTSGPALEIDVPSTCAMVRSVMADPQQRALGGRQVRNILQTEMRRLTGWLAANGHARAGKVRVRYVDGVMAAEVDGAAPIPISAIPSATG